MKRTHTVMILFLIYILVWVPTMTPFSSSPSNYLPIQIDTDNTRTTGQSHELSAQVGTLNPVIVEHIGSASGVQPYTIGRTDIEPNPGSEAFLPAGAAGNMHSADANGGHFLVGVGGSADFSSPQGTISLWIKWDLTAPHGRFWGQHFDFETRWSSNRLMLDWGGDSTFVGFKNDWVPNHWYFLAITWDDSSNHLAIYWGDENTVPTEDRSTSSWTSSVVGLHTENDIMNSAARTTAQVDGHVDEFRYYSIDRTIEELRSDYNQPLIGSELGLAHYYQFEEDLTDSAGDHDLVSTGLSSFSHDIFAVEGGWRAEQVELNIRDLNRLYALNGTFENGYPGVNVDWSGDGTYYADGWLAQREYLFFPGRQRATYVDTDNKYIILENEGYEVAGPIRYRHYNGTRIYWYQTVNNDQQVEDFEFSMNYLYQRGPIGTNFRDIFEFSFEVLNGSSVLWNWSIDPTNITQRGIWFSTSSIEVNIPNAPLQFEARISLKVDTPSDFIEILETNGDLDGDSANGQFVTFFIDDVSFTSFHAPTPEEVDLNINISPTGTFAILGDTGWGLILLNNSFWDKASIPFSFSSNTSISFEYSSKISKMTRICMSTNSTNLENEGVAYSIELEQSAALSLYTYMQSYPEATELGIVVHYPSDWTNPRVENPLGQDISHEVLIQNSQLIVPSGLADSVGWWKLDLDGPNYADAVSTQIQNDSDYSWSNLSVFNNGDCIRCQANFGTDTSSINNITEVDVTWYLPSGEIWSSEVLHNQNESMVTSQGAHFGPINSTVGEWLVCAFWCNGTEVGYGYSTFELYHRFTFFAHTPSFEIESDDEFTVAVILYDQDNGNPILSDAVITGNWSYLVVTFNPNLAKGWWEADFTVNDLDSGEYVIVVEVSMPYYEISSTIVTIRVPDAESLSARLVRASILGGLLVTISILGIALSRRFYKTIMSKRTIELMILEGRIDDAKNLIGLLVIHRAIGLPVYSNILKGGFQEALLSSFISAISQFRSEFSMDEPTWTAIPITEVVTAVQTDALICAIITVEAPSNRQKTQLETFSREVGGLYDHQDDTMRQMVRTPTLTDEFNSIFESYFDGQLMKRYVGVKKSLPKNLHAVSASLDTMDIDHGVTVDAIIKAAILLGFSERRAHNMVLEAVDDGHLIAAEKKLPPPIELED